MSGAGNPEDAPPRAAAPPAVNEPPIPNPPDPTTPTPAPPPQANTAQGGTSRAPQPVNPLMPEVDVLGDPAALIISNSVASPDLVRQILALTQAHHPGTTVRDLVALALMCYHNGASKYVVLEGTSPGGAPYSSMKDYVEQHCTLRQFCSYYAKFCYIWGKKNRRPPANWSRRGFREEAQYAAFDFFNATLSDAAPPPPGGMTFRPTPAEVLAHHLNAKFAIVESRQQENQHSTRGNLTAMQQVGAPPANPLITFPT